MFGVRNAWRRLACGVVAVVTAASLVPSLPAMAAQDAAPCCRADGAQDAVMRSLEEAAPASARSIGLPTDEVYQAFWRWPVPGIGTDHISQSVSGSDGYSHDGVDIWADRGTPIVASRSGYVSADETAGTLGGYGICVVIDHGDGTSSLYAHMDSRLVSSGDYVEQGQVVGYMGDTGQAYGVHLHFEIRVGTSEIFVWNTPIDPEPFINGHDYDPGPDYIPNNFRDVDYNDPDCWYASVVLQAYEMGLMSGVGLGDYFMPDANVTRGQVLTILWRAALGDAAASVDTSLAQNRTPFPDNLPGQYYTEAVNWAYENGIVSGSNGVAYPDSPATRQELAIFMANYARFQGGGQPSASLESLASFVDYANIEEWARASVAWCVENGVMSGVPQADGTVYFAPSDTASRAEMAKVAVMTVEALQ